MDRCVHSPRTPCSLGPAGPTLDTPSNYRGSCATCEMMSTSGGGPAKLEDSSGELPGGRCLDVMLFDASGKETDPAIAAVHAAKPHGRRF
ncbi:hypothetical protein Pyn_30707 [Prunus yedoensis var. nudiflora]|uniref:Uncharacterized protein n=1 Tax=Prunus yedoensis var. nudiflora TaxID=2094558 RepID=A0A314YFQ4_PRUYE|nr:hypothetical protein Pyn_30707 [Prunus yedoensis var. nudiflora]